MCKHFAPCLPLFESDKPHPDRPDGSQVRLAAAYRALNLPLRESLDLQQLLGERPPWVGLMGKIFVFPRA